MASKQSNADFVSSRLRGLEENHLFRRMRSVVIQGPTAVVDGKKAIHLCSNDYLGLAQNPHVVSKTARALYEVSQCSSRLIAGNNPQAAELEKLLAMHRKTEAALLFPTGYMANLGSVAALADKGSTILSDELNHASIIDACRLSGATVKVFRHNDIEHLERLTKKARGRRIIITEGIFSMDGDVANLKEICKIASDYDALTIVDDAHGDFIFGPTYSGVPALLGASVDVHVSSLSKGLGCFGGYVASSNRTIELLINTSKSFIYTSALPDHLCVAARQAMKFAETGILQERLFANIAFLRKRLLEFGFVIGNSNSQIIPIIIGPEETAVRVSAELLAEGVFAQAIRYPTVKKGSSRMRLSVTAAHTEAHLVKAIKVLKKIGRKNKII